MLIRGQEVKISRPISPSYDSKNRITVTCSKHVLHEDTLLSISNKKIIRDRKLHLITHRGHLLVVAARSSHKLSIIVLYNFLTPPPICGYSCMIQLYMAELPIQKDSV